MRKGFPPGRKVRLEAEVLEELYDMLRESAEGQFLWNNQQIVHLYLNGTNEPWASLRTKRPDTLDLVLNEPKNEIALGRLTGLGWARPGRNEAERRCNHPAFPNTGGSAPWRSG